MSLELHLEKPLDPSTIRPLGKVPRDEWERLANLSCANLTRQLFEDQDPLNPIRQVKLNLRPREYSEMLDEMFLYEARTWRNTDPELFDQKAYARRSAVFSMYAREIRRRADYDVLRDLMTDMTYKVRTSQPKFVADVLLCSTINLYLLVCEPTKFIVGLREGIHWKDVEIPVEENNINGIPLNYIANYYYNYIDQVGREELPIIPSRLIHPGLASQVRFPSGLHSLEDSLEDAFYDKEYDIDVEGARVVIGGDHDIRSMHLLERGREIWAKIATAYGEGLVIINNEDGSWMDPNSEALVKDLEKQNGWIKLTGAVYKDLLTRQRIPVLEDEEVQPPKTITLDPDRPEAPYLVYIPRRYYSGGRKIPRIKYEGPRRPPRMHKVKPYLPAKPMTDKHREELKRWEEETGFKVPEDIPSTHTFVRPHISPTEANERLRELPIFVKSRIQKDMEEQVKELLQAGGSEPEELEV